MDKNESELYIDVWKYFNNNKISISEKYFFLKWLSYFTFNTYSQKRELKIYLKRFKWSLTLKNLSISVLSQMGQEV